MVEPKRKRSFLCSCLPLVVLLSVVFLIWSTCFITDYPERIMGCNLSPVTSKTSNICESVCRPNGTETLPRGIVSQTTDLEMQPLRGPPNKKKLKSPMNLLAIAVGIKQMQNVNEIVKRAKDLNRTPNWITTFIHMHTKGHDSQTWITEKARMVANLYQQLKVNLEAQGQTLHPNEIFYEVVGGKYKQHNIYGLGNQAKDVIGVLSSANGQSSQPTSFRDPRVDLLIQEMQKLKDHYETVEEEMRRLIGPYWRDSSPGPAGGGTVPLI